MPSISGVLVKEPVMRICHNNTTIRHTLQKAGNLLIASLCFSLLLFASLCFSLSHIRHFNLEVGRSGHAHVHLLPAIGVVLGLWSEVDLPAEKEGGWMVGGGWCLVD